MKYPYMGIKPRRKNKEMYTAIYMYIFSRLSVALLFSMFIFVPTVSASEPLFVLKSCAPADISVTSGNSFVSKLGESVTFKCTVVNTGSIAASIRVFGSRTFESNVNTDTFSTSILLKDVQAGQSIEAIIPFVAVFEGGTYQYNISLMGVGSDGKLGEKIGTPINFTGKVDASTVKIISALLDKASYKEGDTAGLSLKLTPTGTMTKDLSVNIALKKKDGSICSYVSMGNPVGLGQYSFRFSSGATSCTVAAVEVSLINNKNGSMVDAITIPVSQVALKGSPQTGSLSTQAGFGVPKIAIIIIGVLLLVLGSIFVFLRRKQGNMMTMWIVLFIPAMLLFGAPSAHAGASCSASGYIPWGSGCGTNYSGTIVDGGGGTLYNTNIGYDGSIFYSCSNGTWIPGSSSCIATAACVFNGYVSWSACGVWANGTTPNGQSATLTNSNSGYSGSATYSCSNGTWSPGANSCTPVGNSCTYSGYIPWGSGCGANYSGTVANGYIGTIPNTNVGHTGSATYSCSNGIFSQTGSSCDVAGASCNFSGTTAWDSCYSNQSVTLPSGESTTLSNENSGYSGSATYYCNNGTWSPGIRSCSLISGGGGAINGVCSTTHYNCNAGTLGTTSDTSSQWQWQCVGSGGGSTASCAETKPAPTATLSASPSNVASGAQSTLTWSSINATSCAAPSGNWSNSGTLSGSGLTNPLTTNTTFTFQCTGPGGTSPLQSATVTVGSSSSCPATTIGSCILPTTFSGSSAAGSCSAGYTGSCSYSCSNGTWSRVSDSCTTPGACTLPWGGTIASGVSVPAFLTPSVTSPKTCAADDPYETRTCTNGTLSGSYTNPNCVENQPVATISASPTRVQSGGTSTISWSSSGANSCSITKNGTAWKTGISSSGVSETIINQTVYTITCSPSVPSKSIIVNVLPSFKEF